MLISTSLSPRVVVVPCLSRRLTLLRDSAREQHQQTVGSGYSTNGEAYSTSGSQRRSIVKLLGMVMETERLRLRRATVDDVEELVGIHADPEITRFMGLWDRERALDWLHQVDENWREHGYGRLAITDAASGRLLGRTGLMYLPQFGETELGWTLRRDAWGHGYAAEAAGACADWAFRDLEIPYLTSLIESRNERSIRVAARLGMTPLRNDVFYDRPMIVYALTRHSWSWSGR